MSDFAQSSIVAGPMRVLILHSAPRTGLPSGESVVAHDDYEALTAAGVTTQLVELRNESKAAHSSGELLQGVWSKEVAQKIERTLSEFHPDVVHIHSLFPGLSLSTLWTAHRARLPLVMTLHNFRFLCVEGMFVRDGKPCFDCLSGITGRAGLPGIVHNCARGSKALSVGLNALNQSILRPSAVCKIVDKFVAVSNFVADIYRGAGYPADQVAVKYNAVPIPEVPAAQEMVNGRGTIFFAGRLQPTKGTDWLLTLFERLPHAHFSIAGDGQCMERLKAAAAQYNVDADFWGMLPRADVVAKMAAANVAVVPSSFAETFCLAAAEALAAGVPVVARRAGALPELLGNSGGGILTDSADEMANAVGRLLDNSAERKRLAQNGRGFAQANLTTTQTAQKLVEIYQSALHQRG